MNTNIFESHLMLNDRCAEMSDHVTGQHLQGMILIEAARQMTLAVTEMYFIDSNDREKISDFRVRMRLFCKDKLENFKVPQQVSFVVSNLYGERFKKMRKFL